MALPLWFAAAVLAHMIDPINLPISLLMAAGFGWLAANRTGQWGYWPVVLSGTAVTVAAVFGTIVIASHVAHEPLWFNFPAALTASFLQVWIASVVMRQRWQRAEVAGA
jgi:hypothetical protein